MIKVWKNYDSVPQEIDLTDVEIEKIRCGKFKPKNFQSDEKSIGDPATIRGVLRDVYHSNCGYCGGKFPPYEVEHYRAKNAYQTKNSAAGEQHAGYFWLCMEWSNLLYSCGACNNAKSSKVPIGQTGKRVLQPPVKREDWRADSAMMRAENLYLLNPELDSPEEHLYFRPNGEICFSTERGKQTIELCKLNRHDLVIETRKKIIDDFQREICEALLNFHQGYGGAKKLPTQAFKQKLRDCFHPLIKRLVHNQLPGNPFSMLKWRILHDIDTFCISRFPDEVKDIFRKLTHLWQEIQSDLEAQTRGYLLKQDIPEIMASFTNQYRDYRQQEKHVSMEKFNQDLKYSFISPFYNFIFLLKGNQEQLFQYIDTLSNPTQQRLLKKAWKLCESDVRWRFNPVVQ